MHYTALHCTTLHYTALLRYKAVLTVTFLLTSGLYILVDVIFQV